MGQPANAGLAQLVAQYGLTAFVEGGTGWGRGVQDALAVPQLAQIHSVEIDQQTFQRNERHLRGTERLTLWHGDTRELFRTIAGRTLRREKVCWYLDAHFPGSGKTIPEPMIVGEARREAIPLVDEVFAIIDSGKDYARDVFIVDDRVLWEADQYDGGDAPDLRALVQQNDLATIEHLLTKTHASARLTADMGYLVMTPR